MGLHLGGEGARGGGGVTFNPITLHAGGTWCTGLSSYMQIIHYSLSHKKKQNSFKILPFELKSPDFSIVDISEAKGY